MRTKIYLLVRRLPSKHSKMCRYIYHGQLLYTGTYRNPTNHTLEITDQGIEYYHSNYLLGVDLGNSQLS